MAAPNCFPWFSLSMELNFESSKKKKKKKNSQPFHTNKQHIQNIQKSNPSPNLPLKKNKNKIP